MTKKSFFKTFLIFSLLIFASLFTSCKVEWFGGLENDLDEKLMTFVRFSAEDPTGNNPTPKHIDLFYLTGTELTKDDFPKTGSKELYELYPGYKIIGEWKNNQLVPNFVTCDSVTGVVEKCIVPPKTSGYIELYLESTDLEARDDTLYTFNYYLQNVYDNEYTKDPEPYFGTTDDYFILYSNTSYQNKLAEGFQNASNHYNGYTIYGDGSLSVDIKLDRIVRTINFNLDSTPIYGGESWTDSVTDPPVDPQGIITKTKESNKYTIKCRHGYDYKRLKEDIQQLRPTKNNYGFYGWTNEGSSSRVCLPSENPYDFILSFDDGASNQFPNSVEGDEDFYPVWGPEFYKIYIKMPQMKDDEFIGTIDGIDIFSDSNGKYINMSVATSLPPPQLPDSYKAEDFEFAGYKYTTPSALNDGIPLIPQADGTWNSIGLSTTISSLLVITATWTYKNIYLDPVGGNDNNDGLSAGTAVQSVSKAKELAKDEMTNSSGNSIYLMNKITDPIELTTLNNITISDYNNVSIKRAEGVRGTLIEIPSGTSLPWRSITFDGNKDKVTATSPFIVNNGTLALKEQIEFKNITSSSTNDYGGVIKNIGTLELGSASYTNDVLFNTVATQKGGAIYNASGTVKLYGNVKFTSCSGNTSAGLPGKANALYIKAGTLEINSFDQQTSGITDLSISLNEGAVIKVTGDYGSGTTDIFNLYLGDESSTGTLNDFDSSGYTLLTADSGTSYIQNVYNKINLPDSTYDASTSTPGWKIDNTGKLVYATFGGGGIRIPTNFIAKFGVIFNGTSNGALYASNPSSPVITLSSPDFEIGITIKLWYDSETDENLVIFASNKVIQNITDPDFQNYTAKIYYSSVETPATLNYNGKLEGSADWPPGEYTVYIYFEYMGVPYSIYIPFTLDY